MENGLLGFALGPLAPPDTVNAYLDSATSPNIVSFEADITVQLPNPSLPILEWQTTTSGSGATATYGASTFTGPSFTQTLASGTLAARCRVVQLGQPVTLWAYSALVTYSAPSGGGGATRTTATVTSASLAPGAIDSSKTIALGRRADMVSASVDDYAWVRLYATAASRTADLGRAYGVQATNAGNGLLAEWDFSPTKGKTTVCGPDFTICNADVAANAYVYATIYKLGVTTGTVTLTGVADIFTVS